MKIEGKRPDFEQPLDRVESGTIAEAGGSRTRSVSSEDHVRVSAEARLAREAVRMAESASVVRPEAVERAKALLAAGELGTDGEAIAEALIKSALES